MAEYHWVANATFSPTKCVFCGDHAGPFIDAHLELDVYGHVWICASNDFRSGCAQQIGRLDNMVLRADAIEEIDSRQLRIDELELALADADASQVVALRDVVALVGLAEKEDNSG